ncbi:glycoside hydrolase superfamily [Globomyces pollinis-pini]|nr:glycoside hydrolase superfamily [Globomyces pollinis-pini]
MCYQRWPGILQNRFDSASKRHNIFIWFGSPSGWVMFQPLTTLTILDSEKRSLGILGSAPNTIILKYIKYIYQHYSLFNKFSGNRIFQFLTMGLVAQMLENNVRLDFAVHNLVHVEEIQRILMLFVVINARKDLATTTGPAPTDFPVSNDGSCGPIAKKKCPTGTCCSQFGNCGGNPKVEDEFCGLGCQKPFGLCFAQPILAKSNTCIPNKVFAPFLDVTTKTTLFNNKNFDLNEARKITGISWYVMAFLLGNIEGGKVVPRWGGQFDLDFYKGQVKTLRDNGGDVAVSFGGFAGIELATLTNDVDEIQAAYQSVINEYQIRWIDIDIEGNNAQDAGANDRRSKALAALKRANPGLRVSFTLPVLPTGLVKLGIEILQNAKDNKLELDLVNIMAMDYGNIKDGATAMGKHAIEAAEATFKQLQNMGLTKTTIGITTMIGNNDVAGEIFTLDNAKEINEYYLKTPFVSFLSIWNGNRDTFIANGELLQTSQIPQQNFQFQKLLNQGASPVCNAPEKVTTTTTSSNVSTTSKISEVTRTKDPQTTTNKAVTSRTSTNTKTTTIKSAITSTTTPTATINKTTATIRSTTPNTSTGTTTATTRTTTKSTTTTTKRTTSTATPTTRTIAKQTTFNTKTTTKTATPNTTKTTTTMANSKTTTKTSTTLTSTKTTTTTTTTTKTTTTTTTATAFNTKTTRTTTTTNTTKTATIQKTTTTTKSTITPTSSCSHSICFTGGGLLSSCDPCVAKIISVDQSCSFFWDGICVAQVFSICGLNCVFAFD